jgi:hypothetical protein
LVRKLTVTARYQLKVTALIHLPVTYKAASKQPFGDSMFALQNNHNNIKTLFYEIK